MLPFFDFCIKCTVILIYWHLLCLLIFVLISIFYYSSNFSMPIFYCFFLITTVVCLFFLVVVALHVWTVCVCMLSHVWFFATPWICSLTGSSVQGISQAGIWDWVVISYSRGSSQFRDLIHVSCIAGGFFTAEPPGIPISILLMVSLKVCHAYLSWQCLSWLMYFPSSQTL